MQDLTEVVFAVAGTPSLVLRFYGNVSFSGEISRSNTTHFNALHRTAAHCDALQYTQLKNSSIIAFAKRNGAYYCTLFFSTGRQGRTARQVEFIYTYKYVQVYIYISMLTIIAFVKRNVHIYAYAYIFIYVHMHM